MVLSAKKAKAAALASSTNNKYAGYGHKMTLTKNVLYNSSYAEEDSIPENVDSTDGEMSVRYLEKQFYKVISANKKDEKIKLWFLPIITLILAIAYTSFVWIVHSGTISGDEDIVIRRYLSEYIYRCLTQDIFFIITIPLRISLQKEMDRIKRVGFLNTGRKISYISTMEDLITFLVTCLVLFETGIISFFDVDKAKTNDVHIKQIMKIAYIVLEITITIELALVLFTSVFCLYYSINHNFCGKDQKDALGELMYTGKHHYINRNANEKGRRTQQGQNYEDRTSNLGDDTSMLGDIVNSDVVSVLSYNNINKKHTKKTCMNALGNASTDTILRQSDVMAILALKRDELNAELLEKQRLLTKLQDSRSQGQDSSAAVSDLLMDMVENPAESAINNVFGIDTSSKLINEDSATINARLREKKNALSDETEVLKLKAARLSSTIKMQTSKLEGLKNDLAKRTSLVSSLRDEVATLQAEVTEMEAKAQLYGIKIEKDQNAGIEPEFNNTDESSNTKEQTIKKINYRQRTSKYNEIGDNILNDL